LAANKLEETAHEEARLVLAAGLAAMPAMAQDKTVDLKISIWLPPAHSLVPATKEWAQSIEKESGGTIKTAIFPSEQLGKAFDHYDMARDGIADVVYVNPGYQPGRFPVIAAGQIPFTFGDAARARRRSTPGTASMPPPR
jgi:TRAP-type C4-dicarboxylate transport system substrate-binding protein